MLVALDRKRLEGTLVDVPFTFTVVGLLLGLQGDEVVTAEESQQAYMLLQTATAEVKALRSKLAERESKQEALEGK